jgi:hypothetical protein
MKRLIFFVFTLVLFGCSSEPIDEPLVVDNTDNTSEPSLSDIAFNHPTFDVINPVPWLEWKDQLSASLKDESIDTEDFIWNALNIWYFWKSQTPALSETRFNNLQDYLDYLKGFSSAESMIESITNTEDRFTFFNEDYSVLINSLGGISWSCRQHRF